MNANNDLFNEKKNLPIQQAQQFEWVENLYPGLWTKIQECVKRNQFFPIGGVKSYYPSSFECHNFL